MKAIAFPIIITGALIASIFNLGDNVQKTKILSDNSRITYNVNDKNKLDGAYFVENTQRNIWLRGTYKEEKRAGNWYAFNSDKTVFIRYNYDLKKLLFIDTVALKKAEIAITDKNDDAVKNASPVLPICSIDQFLSVVGQAAKVDYPKDILIYNQPIDVVITAKVKSATDVSYAVTYKNKGEYYAYPIKKKDIDLDIDWIPSSYNGKDVEAEFRVPAKLIFNAGNGEAKRFVWNY